MNSVNYLYEKSGVVKYWGTECILRAAMNKKIIFFIITLGLFSGCTPEKEEKTLHSVIGGKEYFIPKPYFVLSTIGMKTNDNIYIRAMYPHFEPVTKDTMDMKELGIYHQKIRVLASFFPDAPPFYESAKKMVQGHFKALEVVGKEYELIHQKQPEGEVQDKKDVWVEYDQDQKIMSYIACSEKLSIHSVPQCGHRFHAEGLSIRISYDKRMLSDWKSIQEKVITLLKSFKSQENALKFYKNAIENYRSNEGEK